MPPIEDFLKRPASKQDLILAVAALWLMDSGTGAKGLEAAQEKIRGLLGAAKQEEKPEAAK